MLDTQPTNDDAAQAIKIAVADIVMRSGLLNAHDIAPNGAGNLECHFLDGAYRRVAIGSEDLLLDVHHIALLFFRIAEVCENPEVKTTAHQSGTWLLGLVERAVRLPSG